MVVHNGVNCGETRRLWRSLAEHRCCAGFGAFRRLARWCAHEVEISKVDAQVRRSNGDEHIGPIAESMEKELAKGAAERRDCIAITTPITIRGPSGRQRQRRVAGTDLDSLRARRFGARIALARWQHA
jgi:hypothetical protein